MRIYGRWLPVFAVVIEAVVFHPGTLLAQTAGKLAEQPIVVLRSNKLSGKSMLNYITELNDQLQIGSHMMRLMDQQGASDAVTRHPNPVTGQMFFMVQGMIPGAEAISFSQVADEADFDRMVRAGQSMAGTNSTLEGSDGKFKQTINSSWREDVTDRPAKADGAADQGRNSVSIGIGLNSSSGTSVQVSSGDNEEAIIEEDGRRYVERTFNMTQYFRYHDGFMFSSTYEDLFNMDLPSGDSLVGAAKDGMDAELDFYPDRIPLGFKHLFWNTIHSTAGTELQQRDEEDAIDYAMRRSAGDIVLEAIRAVIFDVDQLSSRMTLADVDRPLTGELKFRARQNSNFSKRLGDYTSGRSRFAPILNDEAAFTLHTCVHLPEETQKVITSTATWLKTRLIETSQGNVDVAIAGSEFGDSMEALAAKRDIEMLIKVGWTPSSGAVVYGGLQVDDNPEMLKSLFDLLTSEHMSQEMADRFSMGVRNQHSTIVMQLPNDGPDSPLHITHLFITHVNSCLWFAAGGEDAHDILWQSIERCGASGRRTRTPLLTGRLDLARWTSWPQDEPTGLAALPYWLDRIIFAGASSITTVGNAHDVDAAKAKTSDSQSTSAPTPASSELMAKVISMGGTQDANLLVDADESGVLIEGNLGAAVARYVVARGLMLVDNRMAQIPADGFEQQTTMPAEVVE